jgi:hypothetical protein
MQIYENLNTAANRCRQLPHLPLPTFALKLHKQFVTRLYSLFAVQQPPPPAADFFLASIMNIDDLAGVRDGAQRSICGHFLSCWTCMVGLQQQRHLCAKISRTQQTCKIWRHWKFTGHVLHDSARDRKPVQHFTEIRFETQIEARTWQILCSFRPHTCEFGYFHASYDAESGLG